MNLLNNMKYTGGEKLEVKCKINNNWNLLSPIVINVLLILLIFFSFNMTIIQVTF